MVKFEDLTQTQQAILANLPEDTAGFSGGFDALVKLGLIDGETSENTSAGNAVLDAAIASGYLRSRHERSK